MALPRLVRKASSLLFNFAGNSSSLINGTPASQTTAFAQSAESLPSAAAAASSDSTAGFLSSFAGLFSLSKLSNLDGIFSYIASRWALSTFMIAIVLNRAHVYSAPRRHVQLNWQTRFALRLLPIAAFLYQIVRLLQATRCQAGDFIPRLVHRDSQTIINNAFAGDSGFLYKLSAGLLFWQDDVASCYASGMVPTGEDKLAFIGSATVLWPLFLTLCLSHLVETISCSLEGRQPMAETGMTIFEHSLAFAEAEAVVRSSIGMGLWGMPSNFSPPAPAQAEVSSSAGAIATTFTREMIMTRLNVPPEVMLIGLISCASHISNHCLAILGIQSRCRLVNTSVWGLCYMTAFAWSFWKSSRPVTEAELSVLRYPTVCIIGFVPHLLIVAGIFICAIIYCVSLVALALSPGFDDETGPHQTFRQRLRHAFSNMQANTTLANIHVSWHEEFYTTLLKVGFTMLTMASQAVYFNEGTNVRVAPCTWIEENRLKQLARARALTQRVQRVVPPEIQGDFSVADGIGLSEEAATSDTPFALSGYARERKTTQKINKAGVAATHEDGVGGHQRSGRWYMSWKLMTETLILLKCCLAKWLLIFCGKIGVTHLPLWLREAASFSGQDDNKTAPANTPVHESSQKILQGLASSDSGDLSALNDPNIDIEVEMRRRTRREGTPSFQDHQLDEQLYEWWKHGGALGEADSSGEFAPTEREDDLTSMISESEATSSVYGSESGLESGQQTPTQEDYDQPENSMKSLARLLHPKTMEDKQEARLLAQRLTRSGPMTRSQYRSQMRREDTRMFFPGSVTSSPQDEEELLELLIRSKRGKAATKQSSQASDAAGTSWTSGAAGMGDSGPQCVVCHDAPRTILVWPCRCLSLCETCRVDLAMNNYGTCVCCRRDVVAFSRLFVP